MSAAPAPNDPTRPDVEQDAPAVELVDLDALTSRPLRYPPAIRTSCACGKDGTDRSHGAIPHPHESRLRRPLSCQEVLAIRARVQFGELTPWQRLRARLCGQRPEGWPR